MLTSIDVKFIFDTARLGLSSSTDVALTVLAMFLAIISLSSYSWNEWNVRHFCQLNLVPRSSRLTVHQPARKLHFWRHRFINRKILPKLAICSWLRWIMRVLLANQNGGNILSE